MTDSAAVAFVLASGSQGRLRLLRDAGMDPEVVISGADETDHDGLPTADLVTELAGRKAAAVASLRPHALVLGCDSLLDLDGVAYGKPASAAEAAAMWQRMAGREGTLCTGHCLIDGPGGRQVRDVARTVVRFGTPGQDELAAYIGSGEPFSLAGAFSLDGRSAPFVDGIDGDPGTVIGLSLPLLRRMLAALGRSVTDLWNPAG
ncbi:MAG TPA: Maf family protein [Streptosporangiaceae bacterium]